MSEPIRCAVATACTLFMVGTAASEPNPRHHGGRDMRFERVATFPVCENTSCDRDVVEETAAEIVAASEDGKTLIYTDSPSHALGFVDIRDPSKPRALGAVRMDGEPTSVAVRGRWALVAVNTSESFGNPTGYLGVFDIAGCAANVASCEPVGALPLAGQPDSVAVSPDGRYAAVIIENERDEDVVINGVEGGLPQAPSGLLQVVTLHGQPAHWTVRSVDLTGLAAYGAEDAEPEYVSINARNVAAITLQENNHIALVHLPSARVIKDFPAGELDLQNVDTDDEGLLDPIYSLDDLAREPDAVGWLNPLFFATANKGDLFGGSRGFSIFNAATGKVWFDSGVELEYLALAHGHYPDDRGDNKGVEPEGIAFARYRSRGYLFVGMERANLTAVYELRGLARPRFVQALPSGIGPEGLLPIPKRNLFVVAAEDDEDLRSTISIYALRRGPASYPTIVSDLRKHGPLAGKAPIGWVALSALAADRADPKRLYTVNMRGVKPAPQGAAIPTLTKTLARDLLPDLSASNGWLHEKVEGVAVASDGAVFIVTDNDGVDDNTGETQFMRLGTRNELGF